MSILREVMVFILLTSVYGITYLIAVLGKAIPRRPWKPTNRVLVTGAFYNPGWYLSHMTPLSRCGMKEVIVVTDVPQVPLERVRVVYPPDWAVRLLGRVGARTIWGIVAGLRYRADLYMGYYLAPGACSALIVSRFLGRPSCYQMTGGPVGVIGGGFAAVDSIEGSLGRPSKFIETLALKVIQEFELVVVRGNGAKEFLAARGIEDSVTVITGCVRDCRQSPQNGRDIDLIYVGRLSPVKQLDQYVAIVDSVRHVMPNVRAVIVGDGPLRADLQKRVEELGVSRNIEFLGKRNDGELFLSRSKIFMLTSKSEGLSIAMAEAMTAGVVPIVANVGDLADLVVDGENGYLMEPDNIKEYTSRVVSLLHDESLWTQLSEGARDAARRSCSVETVTEKWRQSLRKVIAEASGCAPERILNHELGDLTRMKVEGPNP